MSAKKFLDLVEQQGLLDESIVADLRRQVDKSSKPLAAEKVAKLLVQKGHLTKFQAAKLLTEATGKGEGRQEAPSRRKPKKTESSAHGPKGDDWPDDEDEDEDEDDDEVVMLEPAAGGAAGAGASGTSGAGAAAEEDELGLLDDEDESSPAAKTSSDDLMPVDDTEGLTPVDDDDPEGLTPLDDDAEGLTPLDGDAEGLTPLDDDPEGLAPLDDASGRTPVSAAPSGGLEPLDSGGLSDADLGGGGLSDANLGGGGLEELGDEPGAADPFAEGALDSQQAAPATPKGPKKKTMRSNPWDSPLLLAGGFGLLLLGFLVLVLYLSLTRGNASEVFQMAEEDYRNQAYTQAIDKYERFLKSYPQDPDASLARVRINMARIRQSVEGSSDPQRGLEAAQEYLPEIQEEEAFNEARLELTTLLPDIAAGFAQKAKVAVRSSYSEAESLLESASEAMELVDNPLYIPASLRKGQVDRLRDISELMEEVRRNIDRDRKLENTLAAMRDAINDDKTREAYNLREALLKEFPGLQSNEELVAVVREITDRQRDLVTSLQPQIVSQAADPDSDTGGAHVVLAARSGSPIPDIEGHLAYVLAHGGVYGIDASTGQPLWRRFVGEAASVHPEPVSEQPGADALVVDPSRQALLRLAARTGEVVWQLPVGEEFRAPTVVEEHALVTTESGKVLKIALASGEITAAAQLPPGEVPLVSPDGAPGRPAVYQPGDHDNLYALGQDQLDAREVFYLGHKSGTILVPPVSALGHVFVAENAGRNYTLLHIIATNRDGTGLAPAQAPLRLEGKVVVRPVVSGRRVTVVTDLGAIYVYDVNPQHEEGEPPVTQAVAPLVATSKTPMVSYFQVEDTQLWVGDTRLAKYGVQVSRQKLNREWSENVGAVFVAPMQHFGNALIQVRRDPDAPGVTVSAINDNDFKQVLWTVELAVPTLDLFVDGQEQVRAVSMRGGLFTVDDEARQKHYAGAAAQSGMYAYTSAVDVGAGRFAYFSPAGRLLVYDPQRSMTELRSLRLTLQGAQATADPIGFSEGVLLPLDQGEVVLLDPASGSNMLLPFHPQLEAGKRIEWLSPALLPNGEEFVIADNGHNLLRIGAQSGGQPHLAERAKATVNEPLRRGLAVAGDTVYSVVRGGSGDEVVSYSLPQLEPGKKWKLTGRIHWGPQAVGDAVFVATETDGLLCFGPGQKERWKVGLPHGPVAAAPRPLGDDYLISSKSGVVWLAEGASGKELAARDVGEPLAGTPLLHQGSLYVAGADGTLQIAEPPE